MAAQSTVVGIDAGATLAKFAIGSADAPDTLRFESLPASDTAAIAARVARLAPARIGVTGCGGQRLVAEFGASTRNVNEVNAWGRGATRLLSRLDAGAPERFLVVSVGTGTSVMLVDGEAVTRVGGTALGGGVVHGLGRVLTGIASFDAICDAAQRGDAGRADLLIGDIYSEGEIGLPSYATAASFGKLGQGDCESQPEDLLASLMNLVGDNIALLCAGLAAAADTEELVFGGSTLHSNPVLVARILGVTAATGRRGHLLPDGQFAGALGAYEHVRAA